MSGTAAAAVLVTSPDQLADDVVTGPKLAADSVGGRALREPSVGSEQLSDSGRVERQAGVGRRRRARCPRRRSRHRAADASAGRHTARRRGRDRSPAGQQRVPPARAVLTGAAAVTSRHAEPHPAPWHRRKAGLIVIGLAALALWGAQTSHAGVSLNTIDRHVTYKQDGARVRSTGPIRCTRGERITISARVGQAATGARARKRWQARCTGEVQHWQARARARGAARFAHGPGRVCAVAKTRAGGRSPTRAGGAGACLYRRPPDSRPRGWSTIAWSSGRATACQPKAAAGQHVTSGRRTAPEPPPTSNQPSDRNGRR
jgi:hypothetical protein